MHSSEYDTSKVACSCEECSEREGCGKCADPAPQKAMAFDWDLSEWEGCGKCADPAPQKAMASNADSSEREVPGCILAEGKKEKYNSTRTRGLILKECAFIRDVLLQKNKEYGDSALNPLRIFASSNNIEQINIRIDDKLSRIAYQGEKNIKEDTVLDLIGYLILKRIAEKEEF